MGLLRRFNDGKLLNIDIRSKIEKFFAFKWANDKLMAIDEKDELKMLE